MPFTIGGITVQFDLVTFENLAGEEKLKWEKSSLKDLRNALARRPASSADTILAEIRKLPVNKREKYKSALKYVIFSWPNLVPAGDLQLIAGGAIPNHKDFQQMFATMNGTTDFVDLMYGINSARGLQPYTLTNGRARFADDFNNAAGLGTGLAFERAWNGIGTLAATPKKVAASFARGDTETPTTIQPATRMEYVNAISHSRYAPERSFKDTKKKLATDTHQSMEKMVRQYGPKQAELHYWMHARFVKAVRRACKGGIAMVASHPGYRRVDAKVHFALDGLGDLGAVARKDRMPADKGGYLAITSSELCFCCRYWDDPEFPLQKVVKFYVNGTRVFPPWEADYSAADANGAPVISNQEAWLRYKLALSLLSVRKPFPRMGGESDDA